MEGVSLAPVLGGESLPERPLFFEHEGNRAVRQGRWKLVERFNGEGWELYDLQSDRAESSDLAAAQPERVAELRQRYADWTARVGVLPWPLGRP
jgi:arylsulfatase